MDTTYKKPFFLLETSEVSPGFNHTFLALYNRLQCVRD